MPVGVEAVVELAVVTGLELAVVGAVVVVGERAGVVGLVDGAITDGEVARAGLSAGSTVATTAGWHAATVPSIR
ncbi:MAG: hypothetical protein ACT4OP_12350 [Actinomycetota bacterium]